MASSDIHDGSFGVQENVTSIAEFLDRTNQLQKQWVRSNEYLSSPWFRGVGRPRTSTGSRGGSRHLRHGECEQHELADP